MTQTESFENFLRDLSPSAFKVLGLHQLAYIKTGSNKNIYEVRGADGQILASFSTLKKAMDETQEKNLKPVTVH